MTLDDELGTPSPTFSSPVYHQNIVDLRNVDHHIDVHPDSSINPSHLTFDIDPSRVSIMIDLECDQDYMKIETCSQVNETF